MAGTTSTMIKPKIKEFSGVSSTDNTKTVISDDKKLDKSAQGKASPNTTTNDGVNATAPNQAVGSSQLQVGGTHEEPKNRFAVVEDHKDFAKENKNNDV